MAVFKLIFQMVRHPVRVLRAVNRDTFRLALGYLKHGDLAGLAGGIGYFVGRTSPTTRFRPEITYGTLDPESRIELPACSAPVVSIIIPVHNQWDFTHSCLAAILRYSGALPFEVILADDASTDATCRAADLIANLRVVRNASNLGFLRNCNAAAKAARGRYLLFLNNDTNVQPGWLAPLVTLLEGDPGIGIAGSKLVFPDGMLQEAGGIMWEDASGWNFGWRDDPEKPDYNYLKDVDYVSGASLMVRRDLWEQAGGFDPCYVPAYFEDTDLAFRARALGYRVVYQPQSVVVHFEGISHGKDLSSGIKSHQEINRQKFRERWREVLERDHFPNRHNVFQARDRSRYRKAVLVIDHYVPTYDRDAGSFFCYSLLKSLCMLGYRVVFWPENLYAHQPYTGVLQQLGVEVRYGEYQLGRYLEEFGANFHAAIVTRNHVAINCIEEVRRFIPKVLYHDPDLEFLREERRCRQEGTDPRQVARIKQREFFLFRNCDVVSIHSPVERDIILQEMPQARVEVLPLPVHDVAPGVAPFAGRRGLLFVGGTHPPNVDALRYFIGEILPLLAARIPGVTLTVAGEVSRHELDDLDLSRVIFTGYLRDLRPLFEQALVYVAPLRFGAGIKGKILEAITFGLPVVTTSIGAEGIGLTNGVSVLIADHACDFAAAVLRLGHDQELWQKVRASGREHVARNFSQAAFRQRVAEVMTGLLQ
jgi:GT2 family glycosyltransferase